MYYCVVCPFQFCKKTVVDLKILPLVFVSFSFSMCSFETEIRWSEPKVQMPGDLIPTGWYQPQTPGSECTSSHGNKGKGQESHALKESVSSTSFCFYSVPSNRYIITCPSSTWILLTACAWLFCTIWFFVSLRQNARKECFEYIECIIFAPMPFVQAKLGTCAKSIRRRLILTLSCQHGSVLIASYSEMSHWASKFCINSCFLK